MVTVTSGQCWSKDLRMENTKKVFSILLGMHHGVSAPTPWRNMHRMVRMCHGAQSGQRKKFGQHMVLQIMHWTGPYEPHHFCALWSHICHMIGHIWAVLCLVLWVAWAGLFWTMNYSIKYCSDFLELAEDPPGIEEVYLHKYFQIFYLFYLNW